MANEIKHTFTDSNIEINVIAPGNYTGNGAEIAQYPWSNEMASGDMGQEAKQSIYGHLMNCMQINWGNAKATSVISDDSVNSLMNVTGIKTSDELISIIYWMYNNITTPLEQITCTLTAQSSTINAGGSTIINASFTGSNSSLTDKYNASYSSYLTAWGINDGSFDDNIYKYTSSSNYYSTVIKSATINVTNNKTSISNNGDSTELSISDQHSFSTNTKTEQVTAKFNNKDADKVNVTIEPATIRINSIAPTVEISQYEWSISSGSRYADITNTNTNKCTITSNGGNDTGIDQKVTVKCTITYNINGNSSTKDFTKDIIVKKVEVEPVTYYWYVGQTNPSTMTSIDPIVTDMTSPGWRLIGTTLPTYSSTNKLYDAVARQSDNSQITTGKSPAISWVAIPYNSADQDTCPRDGFGNDGTAVDICTNKSNITLGGVEYKVYEWNYATKYLGYDIY